MEEVLLSINLGVDGEVQPRKKVEHFHNLQSKTEVVLLEVT